MSTAHVKLWEPSPDRIRDANLTRYMQWLSFQDIHHTDYSSLWRWSVNSPDEFWPTMLSYFNIQYDGVYNAPIEGTMPHVKWFEGIKLNFAEHVFRKRNDQYPAIVWGSETTDPREISWKELKDCVAAFANFLKQEGVKPGDRVAAYIPCIPEATIAFLATNAIGAVWSSCSPDFGTQSVVDRFQQIEPKVFIAVDSYTYGGKSYDKLPVVTEIVHQITSIRSVVIVSKNQHSDNKYVNWQEATRRTNVELKFERVPFSHPIWVLYSSGTTGLPKAITHSHGGILLEHYKYLTFHNDLHENERLFWYTTTGWMMWNYVQGTLLCGATAVLYDGHPGYPDLNRLWEFCERARVNHFGTSAGFILACRKGNVKPGELKELRSISSTGSTLPEEGFEYIYQNIKKDIWLASMSGGTDVCSAFVGGNPLRPVYSGEIQCRALGCSLEAWNEEGKPVVGEVGEMVITKPMPSMPVYLWNDKDFSKYEDSYFSTYPGVWRHGDWIEVTNHDGIVIYGRSDATLNRGGVRIGTSEVYRAVDKVAEVQDSMVICVERPGGKFYMPLFVVLKEGNSLTEELKKKINNVLRNDYSPRHVPDDIFEVSDIPYTISGKKTETPVKKILMGKDPAKVINTGALRNPSSMDFFVDFYRTNIKK
ncbi:MAG TPA: acetoacetate--CoA ligase [Cyclobacteriaceae bacterium]|nr:acetoacetate--CoA ligase [Cyclobacteriaceae bacterium]